MFVKVCGLSTPESVRAAVAAGADAVGFVLTPSPREVSPSQARTLLRDVPQGIAAVGVFRHESAEEAVAAAKSAGLEWIQLHGERTAADVKTAHDAGLKVIRAVTIGAPVAAFGNLGEDVILVDAAVPGSGEAWDYASVKDRWAGAAGASETVDASGRHWLLAGGLDAANVAAAAEAAGAWGVDVSSGVESSRGVKDLTKISEFVAAAKK
ncbi:phosphoribosylanthranilate isomerase [Pseudarthrobacter sp. J64]|uniref:phosphoribosylanthranilate isomerase n=1 Tax=Pseudarthrobacter sp. J64 TaxID=3116485 RepID=UPI002E81F0BC|nr:phosphoribosylanthranilate isomerase [Pseudarthrobacter sp. J64]MEE2568779.1 phosphoribosylanthranilate isomerase [Pseudarthrobacter sp. J64]